MATPPKSAPVDEMTACAQGCADWFVTSDLTTRPADLADILTALDSAKIAASPTAPLVLSILCWLWLDVLPPVDGRREADRIRAADQSNKARAIALGIPEKSADFPELFFGSDEHNLAYDIRNLVARIEALKSDVLTISERQRRRGLVTGQNAGVSTVATFESWWKIGELAGDGLSLFSTRRASPISR